MKKIFIPLFLILALIIIFIFIFLRREKGVRFSGYFEAKEVVLSSKISSRVIKISKKEGEEVKREEKILLLDSREIENKINQANKKISAREEKLKSLELKIKRLKKDLLSLKKIYKEGGSRKREIEKIEDEIKMLEYEKNSIIKEVSAFREEIKNLEILKEETVIKSPCKGKINEIYYETGELVNPGFPLVKIVKDDTLEFIFFVIQKYLPDIKQGHSILIKPTPLKRFYKGEIFFISEKGEFTPKNIVTESEKERMVFKIKAKVFNKDNILKPGMTGYVEWKKQ